MNPVNILHSLLLAICLTKLIVLHFCSTFFLAEAAATAEPDDEWDINWRCRKYIKRLASSYSYMAECAMRNSAPPSVCTQCYREYIDFREEQYRTQHLDNVFTEDNKTCTTAIYNNYVLTYSQELSSVLSRRVWDASKCESCLVIHWDLAHENTTIIRVDDKTEKFYALYSSWHDCVENASSNSNSLEQQQQLQQQQQQVCNACAKQYQALFDHYWPIYTRPDVEFCLDVDAMMNDTFHLWGNVWNCSEPPTNDRVADIRVVAFSATLLAIVIGLFYAGSYIQSEQSEANLIQYSRMQEPRGQRHRLLSSSTLDNNASSAVHGGSTTPSSSQHASEAN